MTDTNSTTLRNALAAAVKNHVEANGLYAREAASMANVQLSRFYQVLRGEVGKISSDALVNMLGNFGYRLTGINGLGDGTEIVLSLDKAEKVLPEIESPITYSQEPSTIQPTAAIVDSAISISHAGHDMSELTDKEKWLAYTEKHGGEPGTEEEKNGEFDPDFDRVVSEDE